MLYASSSYFSKLHYFLRRFLRPPPLTVFSSHIASGGKITASSSAFGTNALFPQAPAETPRESDAIPLYSVCDTGRATDETVPDGRVVFLFLITLSRQKVIFKTISLLFARRPISLIIIITTQMLMT